MMRKIVIPVVLSILVPLSFCLLIALLNKEPFDYTYFWRSVNSCFALILIFFFSNLAINGFTLKDPEELVQVSRIKYEELLKNKEIILSDGSQVPLNINSGKINGASPFNFFTFKSFFEIVPKKSENESVELVLKVKSWNYFQVFDFGYNAKFLRSISKAII